jgi:hypothetical protein
MGALADGIAEARRDGREVARYRVRGGERLVLARQVEGGQALVDVPAEAEGQLFTVDPRWRNEETLAAFLADYSAAGEQMGCCPVSPALVEEQFELEPHHEEAVLDLYWRVGAS